MKDFGVLLSDPIDGGGQQERAFLKCVHCDHRWIPEPGSGRTRGYCQHCNGVTCERPECAAKTNEIHVPWQGRMEILEGTRPASLVAAPVLIGI